MKNVFTSSLAAIFILSSCTHNSTKVESPKPDIDALVPYKPGSRTPAEADIDWWAATAQQVQNATCRQKYPTTAAEIFNYYKKLPAERGYEPGTSEVAGISLVNERPQLVLALAKLLTPASEFEAIKDAPKNFSTHFKINPSCTKALCAAQKIFGAEVGPQMLFLMDKFDVNTSPYSFVNADTFSPTEIADVIRTFELVHPDQLPFDFNKQLIKFKRGYTRASYGEDAESVLANAVIELFDGWSKQNSLMRQYTLYHEIAHNHSDNQFADYDRTQTWLNLSDWKETKAGEFQSARTKTMKGHPFVSKYGKENPFEDFAESVTAFRFNPALLKRQSGEKYNLIRQFVYDGLEYGSAAECRRTPLHKQLQARINKEASTFSAAERETIIKSCRIPFYQAILGNTPTSFFDACVDYEATLIWQKQNVSKYPDLVPQALFDPKLRKSNLKFPELRQSLNKELTPEASNWIFETMDMYTHKMNSQMSNAEYCDIWANLGERIYPEFNTDGQWRKKGVMVNREYKPRSGAARGLCLDLVKGYTPSSKSTSGAIKGWLKEKAYVGLESQLTERGITKETLQKYISDRMR